MRFLVSDSNNRKKLVFVKLIILLIVSAVCFISNNSTVHAASGTLSEVELKNLIEEKLENCETDFTFAENEVTFTEFASVYDQIV